jgi:antitoxin MazE
MKANLIRIGNSRGVRIPKAFLDQAGLHDAVDIALRGSQLIIRAANHPRQGWEEAFAAMAANGADSLLDPPANTQWDDSEWEW